MTYNKYLAAFNRVQDDHNHGLCVNRTVEDHERDVETVRLACGLFPQDGFHLDRCDLMVDEFMRIKACPAADDEIKDLCDRAISQTRQNVPVLERMHYLESEIIHLKASAPPKGWVAVPKEPTEEMHNAARDWSLKKYGQGIGIDASDGVYKAMLSAAPTISKTEIVTPPSQDWQPIETAKKEKGNKIIGARIKDGEIITCTQVEFMDTSGIYHPIFGKCQTKEWWVDYSGDLFNPSHWMPIPAAQKIGGE